jgi:hypothetical protein
MAAGKRHYPPADRHQPQLPHPHHRPHPLPYLVHGTARTTTSMPRGCGSFRVRGPGGWYAPRPAVPRGDLSGRIRPGAPCGHRCRLASGARWHTRYPSAYPVAHAARPHPAPPRDPRGLRGLRGGCAGWDPRGARQDRQDPAGIAGPARASCRVPSPRKRCTHATWVRLLWSERWRAGPPGRHARGSGQLQRATASPASPISPASPGVPGRDAAPPLPGSYPVDRAYPVDPVPPRGLNPPDKPYPPG